jgi:hypothetical protein
MAPKASAPAHLVITGKLKGPLKISRDGTAVVVKKTLSDGTQVEERFPKRRMRGKRKANEQLIPVEDVARGMEGYAQTIEPEVQRRIDGMNRLANELLDREIAKERQKSKAMLNLANRMLSEEKKRTRHQAGKTVAAKQATRAAWRVAGQYRQEANQAADLAGRAVQHSSRVQSLAETIARHLNEGV